MTAPGPTTRDRRVTVAKRVGIAVAVALVVYAVATRGRQLADHASELSVRSLALSEVAVLGGLWASLMAWRALLADLGSPLPLVPSVRVFFLGQLGKYVPGSVWPVVAQMEMGRQHGVPRARSGAVGLLVVGVSLVAGLLIAAATLPFTSAHAVSHYWYAFLLVPVLGAGLVPRIANPVLHKLLTLARRGGLETPLSGRGMAQAFGWSVVMWLGFGLQIYLLAHSTGGARDHALLPLALGGFALAWSLGFIIVFLPAGAGVRDIALAVALAPALGKDDAALVSLASRALMTLGDVALAGVAVLLARGLKTRMLAEVPEEHSPAT